MFILNPFGKGIYLCDGEYEELGIRTKGGKRFEGNSKATAKAVGILAEKEN